jgi:hypothetical protein
MQMQRIGVAVTTVLILTTRAARGQEIPATVSQAEAEGAAFAHAAPPAVVQSMFASRRFGGTSERRCVQMIADDALPGLSLRSGDFIIRGHWSLRAGGRGNKILWLPFHGSPAMHGTPLLVRAVRIADRSDSLRQTILGFTHGGGHDGPAYGWPSIVRFPAPGQWLVIATTAADWGCFILDVTG